MDTPFAVLFPGQGSQKKGMGRHLFDRYPDLAGQADQILGYSVEKLCLEDPDQQLNLTQYTQPALFTVNALHWQQMLDARDALPAFVAGHSLGEYNALVAAGAISFDAGLRLVQKRGELMAKADNGGMAAVIGMAADRVGALLSEHGLSNLYVANINTPSQTVISGDRAAVDTAASLFTGQAGVRYVVLKVSGAFHAPLMAAAAREFQGEVAGTQFHTPAIPVISNVLAAPYPDTGLGELLCRQMVSPVRWLESIVYLREQGIGEFCEAGPGRVLTQMVRAIEKEGGEKEGR